MTTYSETIQARYSATEQEVDGFGRLIKVARLRPWDMSVVRKLADSERTNVISNIVVAACVRSITNEAGKEALFAPPKSEADIAVVMNALDNEGMDAAITAWMRLMGVKLVNPGQDGEDAGEGADTAKN